jgi:hypothetical protein
MVLDYCRIAAHITCVVVLDVSAWMYLPGTFGVIQTMLVTISLVDQLGL